MTLSLSRHAVVAVTMLALAAVPSHAQVAAREPATCGIAVLPMSVVTREPRLDSLATRLVPPLSEVVGRDTALTLVDRSPAYLDSVFAARRRDPRTRPLVPAVYMITGTLERRRQGDLQLALRVFLTETGDPLVSDTIIGRDDTTVLSGLGRSARRLLTAVHTDRARRRTGGGPCT